MSRIELTNVTKRWGQFYAVDNLSMVIEDNAFVGCNSNMVAPVTIGAGAYIGAGSTITKDVPEDDLGIARAKQKNIEGWAAKYRNG